LPDAASESSGAASVFSGAHRMFSFAFIFYAASRTIRRGLADEQFRQVVLLVTTILGL